MSSIKDLISKDKFGELDNISSSNCTFLRELVNQMDKYSEISAKQFFIEWMAKTYNNNQSILDKISYSLATEYSVEKIGGNKTDCFFMTSFLSFNMRTYIYDRYHFLIDFKGPNLLNYDTSIYYELTLATIAMVVNKYRVDTLYIEHIIFVCIMVMLTYFTLYKDNTFLCTLSDVSVVTNRILSSDISIYYDFARKYGFNCFQKVKKGKRPLKKEDVLSFISDGDTQTMIKNKIMKYYVCSDRTAREIMQKFELTQQKYTRKDFLTRDLDSVKEPKDN